VIGAVVIAGSALLGSPADAAATCLRVTDLVAAERDRVPARAPAVIDG